MITGGFGYENGKKKKDKSWSYVVARPFVIELPRSLVQVVVFWNIPMHMWLKNCKNYMLLMHTEQNYCICYLQMCFKYANQWEVSLPLS